MELNWAPQNPWSDDVQEPAPPQHPLASFRHHWRQLARRQAVEPGTPTHRETVAEPATVALRATAAEPGRGDRAVGVGPRPKSPQAQNGGLAGTAQARAKAIGGPRSAWLRRVSFRGRISILVGSGGGYRRRARGAGVVRSRRPPAGAPGRRRTSTTRSPRRTGSSTWTSTLCRPSRPSRCRGLLQLPEPDWRLRPGDHGKTSHFAAFRASPRTAAFSRCTPDAKAARSSGTALTGNAKSRPLTPKRRSLPRRQRPDRDHRASSSRSATRSQTWTIRWRSSA